MVKTGQSIWEKTAKNAPEFPPLSKNMTAEAAVIGGGMAGVLTMHFLRERGVDAVLLESSRIGSGQTGNTTAKITAQHGLIYAGIAKKFGKDKARQYALANTRAISSYKDIIEARNIECDFEEVPAYLYSLKKKDIAQLKEEAQMAKALGIDAQFTRQTTLPFEVAGAVKFNGQAQFHPLKFLYSMANGLKIFENTRVTDVRGQKVYTDKGVVTAEHIVFAAHFPFINVPGMFFARMYQERSYVTALSQAAKLDGVYLEIGKTGLSMRNAGDLLLLGGGDHRTEENAKGGKYDNLSRIAKSLWPHSIETARWAAQDCMTVDGVPYIGGYSPFASGWYAATGFAKWGMTGSMVAAEILSDMITGRENQFAQVFSPERGLPAFSLGQLFKNMGKAVKGLAKTVFSINAKSAEKLRAGQAAIVKSNGEKVGAYRDDEGKIHTVSSRCTHMGCQLSWNGDEKSWDCPCHGSRFDCKGGLIDNPALKDIKIHTQQDSKK